MLKQDEAKQAAGRRAIEEYIRDGMTIALGSGTTSHFFVQELGKHVAQGMKLRCTATSRSTIEVARKSGIQTLDPNELPQIDLTVDGPDEIDGTFNMIKGGGACLLWEKILAHASDRMVTICDESKIVKQLGKFPLPIEVVQFAWRHTQRLIARTLDAHGLGDVRIEQRMRGSAPLETDSGHFILDCYCEAIDRPEQLEIELNRIPGVVENGLFTREASAMIVGHFDGTTSVRSR